MQRKGKWDSHHRGPRDDATEKVNYAVSHQRNSGARANVSKGHQSAEWGTLSSVVRLHMTLSGTAASSSWMLDKLPYGFCFLNEYVRWLFFLLMFLSIMWMGFAQRSTWALLSLHQCGSQPFQLLYRAKYLVLLSTHSLHWSFLSQKGTLPCQHCRIQAVTYHLLPNQHWQVTNHVSWIMMQGKR